MSIPLYKITQQYLSAINGLIEKENDIDYQSISDTLSAIQDEFDHKVLNISAYLKNMDTDIKAMREYEDSMRKRREAAQKKYDSIYKYLKNNLIETGVERVYGTEFNVMIFKSPPSLKIEDEDKISSDYKTIDSRLVIDKKKIKEDLLAGKEVEFASLQQGFYLKIK